MSAVLAQFDPGDAVGDHRADVRPVGHVELAGHDSERRERLLQEPGLGLAGLAELAVDPPHPA